MFVPGILAAVGLNSLGVLIAHYSKDFHYLALKHFIQAATVIPSYDLLLFEEDCLRCLHTAVLPHAVTWIGLKLVTDRQPFLLGNLWAFSYFPGCPESSSS